MTALPLKNRLRPLTLSVWAAGHFWFCLTTMITSRSSDQWIFTGVFTLFHTCRVQMTAITTSGFDFIFQHTTSISTFCTILGNILHSYSYFRFSHSTSGRKPNMEMSVHSVKEYQSSKKILKNIFESYFPFTNFSYFAATEALCHCVKIQQQLPTSLQRCAFWT